MLHQTDCHRILTTPRTNDVVTDALIDAIIADCPLDYPLRIEYIPDVDNIYSCLGAKKKGYSFKAYPPKERSLDDIAVYLHSSGSTGFPKAVPQTFKTLLLASKIGLSSWIRCKKILMYY
jgi:acyl-coenzyme A synthetase/AMP-(fatty) acid ligase